MTKGFHKKKSKRLEARMKYKIAKKVREHHRKLRRESKKNPHKKREKDIGVPNSLPFKEKFYKDVIKNQAYESSNKKRTKLDMKDTRQNKREVEIFRLRGLDSSSGIDRFKALKMMINQAATEKQKREKSEASTQQKSVSNLKQFHKEFTKVIEAADVIIEVLDARDPIGTRVPEIEEAVIKAGHQKRLVLLINKVDLVPKDNLENWIKYLRRELPTIAFKASTQKQKSNLGRSQASIHTASKGMLSSAKCFGSNELIQLLKNYCRNNGIKTSINVGVVGLPNTGKSSVINSLKRSKACTVGSVPGVTKQMQTVILDKSIKLIDCPGIVYASVNSTDDLDENQKRTAMAMLALKNGIVVEQLDDFMPSIEAIIARIGKEKLREVYMIEDFNTAAEFLNAISSRFGMVKKGGVLCTEKAAKRIVHDWNRGKLKYRTEPPETHEMSKYISAEIVKEMSKGFDYQNLQEDKMEVEDEDEQPDESGDDDECEDICSSD